MRAIWKDQIIAESNETILIEGNHYFPKSSLKIEFFEDSVIQSTCPWKGEAKYYNIKVGNEVNEGSAWYYPMPKEGSVEIVGKDFANHVAFWKGVEVTE